MVSQPPSHMCQTVVREPRVTCLELLGSWYTCEKSEHLLRRQNDDNAALYVARKRMTSSNVEQR